MDAASWLNRTNAALTSVCNSGSRSIANWLPSFLIASISALPSPLPYNSPKSDSPIAVVLRASGASSPTHEAYFIKISLTVFNSPRRSMSSRNARTFRGGTHHASSDVSTSFLFSSGTCSQNSWSSNSVYDCTESPACDIISSCVDKIFRSASISVFMRSSSCFTALTRSSPFS